MEDGVSGGKGEENIEITTSLLHEKLDLKISEYAGKMSSNLTETGENSMLNRVKYKTLALDIKV